jgi:Protein of unknown function (DUF2934)
MGNKAKGDFMKTRGEDIHTDRVGLALDQEAIARLAYSYWQDRGFQNDSPDQDWLRAEAEIRNRFAPAWLVA